MRRHHALLKRALLPGLVLSLTASAASSGASGSATVTEPLPSPVSRVPVALLVDLSAGQTLYAHNAERSFAPASMTKAMSVLVAFDMIAAGKLREDSQFTVRPDTAARWSGRGTSMSLAPGERVALRDLLMGMTTASANDASVVLAEGALGSVAAWTSAMNARARALGMRDSNFGTPNGWPDRGATRVSARDMVRLANALIRDHPALYRRYFGHAAFNWHGRSLLNHDPFAEVFPGADGIKTGHSFSAGFNFLGAVERDGRRLVLVIGGAQNEDLRASAARSLAAWGHRAWDSVPLVDAGWVVGTARVQGGAARQLRLTVPRAFRLALPKGTHPRISARIVYQGPLRAPIAKGAAVGGLEISIPGQPVHYLPLVAAEAVGKAGMFDRIANGLLGLFE